MGIAFSLWLTLASISHASAHAVLVFSNPQIEQLVTQAPTYVEVEFDGNLIQLGKAKVNVLTVKDSTGLQIDDGKSVATGPILKVGLLKKKISGQVSVNWRVVSSDGHPVEGGYKFYVGVKDVQTSVPVVKGAHVHENYFLHHKVHIAYFAFGFVVIGLWALISVRILRRRGQL